MADVARELFGQGLQALIVLDFENAVAALTQAAELLGTEQDFLHALVKVYLYYGKALLESSREQNEALGDDVPKNSAEDSERDYEPDEGSAGPSSSKAKNTEKNDAGKAGSFLVWVQKVFQRLDDKESLVNILLTLGSISQDLDMYKSGTDIIERRLRVDIRKHLFCPDSKAEEDGTESKLFDETVDNLCTLLKYIRSKIGTLEKVLHVADVEKESFLQGVKAFNHFENAVIAMAVVMKASQLIGSEILHDLHDALAEVYLYYGKSFLERSIQEKKALEDAVPSNLAKSEHDEDDASDLKLAWQVLLLAIKIFHRLDDQKNLGSTFELLEMVSREEGFELCADNDICAQDSRTVADNRFALHMDYTSDPQLKIIIQDRQILQIIEDVLETY